MSLITAPPSNLSVECLQRAAGTLREAMTSDEPSRRYALAHVAALQATAGLLGSRARPTGRTARQRNAWVLLEQMAPEFADWARFFAAGAAKRAAAEAGARAAVSTREADDLVRAADDYLALVETALGMVAHVPGHVA